ncbi:MAG: putative sugar O-methyltransferase [Acidobacteriota bacterium]
MAEMFDEMDRAPAVYRPSAFWEHFNRLNLDQIGRHGLEHFKRTVNQNYFNWLPTDFSDNQFRNVLADWAAAPDLSPLRVDMEPEPFLEGFFAANPLLERDTRDTYALFVALLCSFTKRRDPEGVFDRLAEPAEGNPIRITLDGRAVSQDLANSVRERNTLVAEAGMGPNPVIAELGAGYGRLAYVLLQTLPCRYLIFDIPPALHVAQHYLPAVLPGRRVFRFRHIDRFEDVEAEIAAADVCFFTPNQLALLPPQLVEVFVSISSLGEMRQEQIAHYLELMGTATTRAIYLKQWQVSTNTLDQITIARDAYRMGPAWQPRFNRPDAVQDQFFEALWVRK